MNANHPTNQINRDRPDITPATRPPQFPAQYMMPMPPGPPGVIPPPGHGIPPGAMPPPGPPQSPPPAYAYGALQSGQSSGQQNGTAAAGAK